MNSTKIMVTGAAGFIGSHLVERLLTQGHTVKAFVRYNSRASAGWLDYLDQGLTKNLEIVLGDIRDADLLGHTMKDCSVVYHLAALIGIPYSYHAPHSYLETNIKGTLNVLQAARQSNCTRVIHTSTSEIYGSAQYVPIDEKHPVNTQSPYSASKAAADNLALAYFYSFQLPVIIIRPFNTFGPRQSLRAVIPNIICQILDAKDGKINLGAISPTRDFSYIDRTVDGFISALDAADTFGEIINLGTGFEISIKQTAEMIANILGVTVSIETEESRLRPEGSEVNRLYSDVSLATKLLRLPKSNPLLDFRQGLERTCDWFKNPKNREKYLNKGYIV